MERAYPFNQRIDNLLMSGGNWEIDPQFATQYLGEYLQMLDFLQAGGEYKDLELANRRQELRPRFINENQQFFDSPQVGSGSEQDANFLAHIRIDGAMRMNDGFSSEGIRSTAQRIRELDADPSVGAFLMEINSGGGESLAGTLLFTTVKEVQKPVFVLAHVMASAALKGMLAADHIFASSRESSVGSIGTMVTINRRILQFYATNYADIYASGSTDKNREFRALLQGDRGPIIERLDQVNTVFQSMVRENRNLGSQSADTLRGGLFLAEDSLERGLIDGIKSIGQIMDLAFQRIHKDNEERRKRRKSKQTVFFNQNSSNMDFKNIIQAINKKLGLSVKEDASEEEITQAIQGATFDSLKNEILQEVKALIPQASDSQADGGQNDAGQADTELETNQGPADQSAAALQEALKTIKALQKEIARLKNDDHQRNDDGELGDENQKTKPPKMSDFKTVQTAGFGNVEIKGNSKY